MSILHNAKVLMSYHSCGDCKVPKLLQHNCSYLWIGLINNLTPNMLSAFILMRDLLVVEYKGQPTIIPTMSWLLISWEAIPLQWQMSTLRKGNWHTLTLYILRDIKAYTLDKTNNRRKDARLTERRKTERDTLEQWHWEGSKQFNLPTEGHILKWQTETTTLTDFPPWWQQSWRKMPHAEWMLCIWIQTWTELVEYLIHPCSRPCQLTSSSKCLLHSARQTWS